MTKRRRNRYIAVGILLTAIAAILFPQLSPTEPSYGGKPMSDWIWDMNGKPEGPEKDADRAIVRRLGSKSMPMLLQWLQEEDRPSLHERFDSARETVLMWMIRHKIIANRPFTSSMSKSDRSHRAMATWALPELEPVAKKQAIPTLINLFKQKKPNSDEASDTANTALYVMCKMAPESISPLIDNLTNQDYQVWAYSAAALATIGPEAASAIPHFQRRLHDRDCRIRSIAIYCILSTGGDPEKHMPILIGMLRDFSHDPDSLDNAIQMLLKHKEQARPAIPTLTEILNATSNKVDPTNSMIRDNVTHALEELQKDSPVN